MLSSFRKLSFRWEALGVCLDGTDDIDAHVVTGLHREQGVVPVVNEENVAKVVKFRHSTDSNVREQLDYRPDCCRPLWWSLLTRTAIQIKARLISRFRIIQSKYFEMKLCWLCWVIAPTLMPPFPWNTLLVNVDKLLAEECFGESLRQRNRK